MNTKTYFVYRHPTLIRNYSDGLSMVVRPDDTSKILFYDQEHDVLFSSHENLEDSIVNESFDIQPASLLDICRQGLIGLVDTISQWKRDKEGKVVVNYIHIK